MDYAAIAYSIVVAAGGVMGYVKKGSIVSGLMGLTFGGLLGYGAFLTSKDPSNYHFILAVSSILTGFMGYRFLNSGKFMPAGLVATISLVMALRYGFRFLGLTSGYKHQ